MQWSVTLNKTRSPWTTILSRIIRNKGYRFVYAICIRIWWNTFNTISLCSEIPLNQKYTAAVQSIDRGYVSASEDQEPPTNPCTRWSSRDLRSVFCAEHSITTGFTLLSFAFAQLEDEEKKTSWRCYQKSLFPRRYPLWRLIHSCWPARADFRLKKKLFSCLLWKLFGKHYSILFCRMI